MRARKEPPPNVRPVAESDTSERLYRRKLRSLIALLTLLATGVGLASYYGWKSLNTVREQIASVQEEQTRLTGRLADLQNVVGAISLEITDQSLSRRVSSIAADLSRLQDDVNRLTSLADEQQQRISDLDTSLAAHDRTLDEITGQFWNAFQDRDLDELNDAVLGIETHLDQLNGQMASIETYLVEVDEGLRRIETCLSRFSDFIPGC